MSDWQELPLGEISGIEIGGTPSRSEERYWWKSDDDGIRLPWVSISDMKEKVITETKESITEVGALQSNCKHVQKGTLLMSFKLTIGRLAFAGKDLYTNEAITAIRPKKDIYPEFLYYGLQHWDLTGDSDQAVKGVTLNKQKLQEIRCLIPPLPEQKKIAEILSGIDQEIIRIQQQIASLEILRTAILEQSLEQLKDCPIHPLHEITKKVTVGIVSKPADHYVSKGVPTLRSMNIKEGRIDYKDLRFISEESNQFFKKSIIREGDILTVRTGVPGTSAVAPADIDGANCVDIIISTPAEGVDSHFLCLQINSDRIKSKVLSGQGGLAQQHFNIGEMRVLDILLPSLDAQKEISSAVLSVSQCIASRCKQRSKYEGVKSAVANDLLSGRKRVSV